VIKAADSRGPKAIALYVTLGVAVIVLFVFIDPSQSRWAFYDAKEWARIAPLLRFAEQYRDGRYLVENLPFSDVDAAHDGRAINAYLGAQGSETSSLFFREGAPNVLFLNPLSDSLSVQADSYGISSTLVDDTDYFNQPFTQHLEQARLFGTKYLVMHSPSMKAKLSSVSGLTRYELGQWSVFDLGAATPAVSRLGYKPALVVSDFSLKLRLRDSYDFMRFAEEQFASGWCDVLLARGPETKLDRLEVSEGFGALIVATYNYDNETAAFQRLKEFARARPLILLSSNDPLFSRIKASGSEFLQLEIIDRPKEASGAWIESEHPTTSYASSGPRLNWNAIKRALDAHKIAVLANSEVASALSQQSIRIAPRSEPSMPVEPPAPILIAIAFHPSWRRTDGSPVYAVTPLFMLTFVDKPTAIDFRRSTLERLGVLISLVTLIGLLGFLLVTDLLYRRSNRT